MQKIIRQRGMGKTTELIKISAKKGNYIVCRSLQDVDRIAEMARSMGLKIPQPVTYDAFLDGRCRGFYPRYFLLDDAESFLQIIFGQQGFELKAMTLTDERDVSSSSIFIMMCGICNKPRVLSKHNTDSEIEQCKCVAPDDVKKSASENIWRALTYTGIHLDKLGNIYSLNRFNTYPSGLETDESFRERIISVLGALILAKKKGKLNDCDVCHKENGKAHFCPAKEEKLKPCPFCGSEDLLFVGDRAAIPNKYDSIECRSCRLRVYGNDYLSVIQGKYKGDEAAALVDKWNTRKHKLSELTTTIKFDTAELVDELKKIMEKLKAQTPHKCPVCDGAEKKRGLKAGLFVVEIDCHACEKGILWR